MSTITYSAKLQKYEFAILFEAPHSEGSENHVIILKLQRFGLRFVHISIWNFEIRLWYEYIPFT